MVLFCKKEPLIDPFVALMKRLWQETRMTVVIVTHDISEAFRLGTRVLVFERSDDDPAHGARITHDIPVWRRGLGNPVQDDSAQPIATRRDDPGQTEPRAQCLISIS